MRYRRTGKPIAQYPKDDDGFEEFGNYFDEQPYFGRSPGQIGRKKGHDSMLRSKRTPLRLDDIDVGGEMSMDLETCEFYCGEFS